MRIIKIVNKRIKKIISILLVVAICFVNVASYPVWAQENTPTPQSLPTTESSSTPQPTSSVQVQNSAEVTNNVDASSNTGNNTITSATSTPSPSASSTPAVTAESISTPTPTGEPTTTASSTPAVTLTANELVQTSSPTSSSSPLSSSSSSPTPTPTVEIKTSDSVSVVEVENNVNANKVNSEVVYHTLNLYLPEEGNIDLTASVSNALKKVYQDDNNQSETVSLKILSVDNFAYVENTVVSQVNTGGNDITASAGTNANITTGNAYSSVSVVNNINTNIVDSKIHLVTINIYGELTGNIILPEQETGSPTPESNCCNGNSSVTNSAVIHNQIKTEANTGDNAIETTAENKLSNATEIRTGEATNVVNVVNLVNVNLVDVVYRYLYINTLGIWVGDFLGWGETPADQNSNLFITSSSASGSGRGTSCPDCGTNNTQLANTAQLTNSIYSSANTGKNTLQASNGSSITTGNAYNSVSIVNFVNSNFLRANGLIGFINIFGKLIGDVGGASKFTATGPIGGMDPQTDIGEDNSQQNSKESGGVLEVTHTNNVGGHVLPGDTVTFSANVKNTGSGKVYGTRLVIELFKNGVSYGGGFFELGDLNPQKSFKLTTGLVLAKNAPQGIYTAKVTAFGTVGPDDSEVSAVSSSSFKILGFPKTEALQKSTLVSTVQAAEESPTQVLGIGSDSNTYGLNAFSQRMITVFSILLVMYLLAKAVQKRKAIICIANRLGSRLT